MELTSENFFHLNDFEHRDLFIKNKKIWELFFHLKEYIEHCVLGNIFVRLPQGAILTDPSKIFIGKGTIIDPGVMIEAPCIIGKNCRIRFGALIRSNTIIGDHCLVGHSSEIKHSVMLNRSAAPHFNYVGDALVGNNVNLGAGVKIANYRNDGKEVSFFLNNQKIYTGLKKFGAIIGDKSKIGCNSVLNPGTFIPKNFHCNPCSIIKGVINEHKKKESSCLQYLQR